MLLLLLSLAKVFKAIGNYVISGNIIIIIIIISCYMHCMYDIIIKIVLFKMYSRDLK